MMPVIILSGVVGGIVTVTESATIAVLYAAFVGFFIYKELTVEADLADPGADSYRYSSLVMFIIAISVRFRLACSRSRGCHVQLGMWIASLSTGIPTIILMIINVLLLIVGIFMEPLPALLILIPVLVPVVKAVGIDLVHFGLVMVFNLCIGLITPPVGILLYICAKFANVTLEEESRELTPFLIASIAVLLIISLFPQTVLWLPALFR